MAKLDLEAAAKALYSVNDQVQARRAQVAQFAIFRAAKHLSDGNQEEAVREFKNALAFDAQNETALTYLGKIYQSQGKHQEAIAEFKKVVQVNRLSVEGRNNLANAYAQDKQYDKAEEEFTLAARLDPSDPLANYTLGLMYTEISRFNEAEAQFEKVAKVSPRDGNVPYSLGVLYNKMGRPEAAIQQLQRALTLKQDFAAANYELGAAYVAIGETEKAEEQMDILVTKDGALASDLLFLLETPRISHIEETDNLSFNSGLGSGTALWMLDPDQLSVPNASVRVAVAINFTNEMDVKSIMNPANWDISRARDSKGGYYNDTMPVGSNEVMIPNRPYSVTYDPLKRQAKIYFIVNQNSSIDIGNGNYGATIDPSHLLFKFSGVDAAGRKMDTSGDQIDGFSIRAY